VFESRANHKCKDTGESTKKLDYDATAGRLTNSPEAHDLLRRQYRPGWTLDG